MLLLLAEKGFFEFFVPPDVIKILTSKKLSLHGPSLNRYFIRVISNRRAKFYVNKLHCLQDKAFLNFLICV